MENESFRMMELGMQGFNCSQILLLMALEAQQRENPDLVRAMSGLLAGLGCGKICGAVTGGCCLLGLYAGKDAANNNADPRLSVMLTQFVEWFETEYTPRYGGIDCSVIAGDDARKRLERCPHIVMESLSKLREILAENDYDFDRDPHSA